MKRSVRWALVSVGLAGVVTAMAVAPSGATPPSGLTNIPLARGTNSTDGTIPLQGRIGRGRRADHRQPWRLLRLALASGGRDRGRPARLAHGVHIARQHVRDDDVHRRAGVHRATGVVNQVINTGTIPYVLFVTFPRVPLGESARTDEPARRVQV